MNFNLRRNSFWAIAEVIVGGLSVFLLYKIVVYFLGTKELGVWSLVLATTSLTQIADIGASAGVTRFVAIALASGDEKQAAKYIDTAFLATLALYCVLGAVFYLPLRYGLSLVVSGSDLMEARSLLPYAIISLILINLNTVMFSALTGGHRIDLKCKIVIVSTFVQVATVVAGISHLRLIAMAWGQIGQYCIAAALARIFFLRMIPKGETSFVPLHFSVTTFKELVGFGLKLQIVNLAGLGFEPLMKFAISSTAGLGTLGIFEMAYRMVLQVRRIVVAPTGTLVPAFAHLDQTDHAALRKLFERAVTISIFGGGALLALLALVAPFASWFLLGHVDSRFVVFSDICALGCFVNLVSAPAYLLGVSQGFIRWIIVGHIVAILVGPVAGFALFHAFGVPETVVIASMAGLAGGSVITWVMICRRNGMPALPSSRSLSTEAKFVFQIVATGLNLRAAKNRT